MKNTLIYSIFICFLISGQCQSMDSGATIAIDNAVLGANPATWSPYNLDSVTHTAEPIGYETKIDPAMDHDIFATTNMDWSAPAPVDAKIDGATIHVDPMVDNAIPMAVMTKYGTPLPNQIGTVAPKTKTATKTAIAKTKSNFIGAKPATLSRGGNMGPRTAVKPAKTPPKLQSKTSFFTVRNK